MQIQDFLESLKIDSPFDFMEKFEDARLAEMLPTYREVVENDYNTMLQIGGSKITPAFKKSLEISRAADLEALNAKLRSNILGLNAVYFSDRLKQALEIGFLDDVRDIFGYIILRSEDLIHADAVIKNTLGGIINETVLKSAQEAFVNNPGVASENVLRMMVQAYAVTNPGFENMSTTVQELFKTVMDKIYNTDLLYTKRYRDRPSEIYSALKKELQGYGFNMENKFFYTEALKLANLHIKEMSPIVDTPVVLPSTSSYTRVKRSASKESHADRQQETERLLAEQQAVTADLKKEKAVLEQQLQSVAQAISELSHKKSATKNVKKQYLGTTIYAVPHSVRQQMREMIQKDHKGLTGTENEIDKAIASLGAKKQQLENSLRRVTLAIKRERSGSELYHAATSTALKNDNHDNKENYVVAASPKGYIPRKGVDRGVDPLTSHRETIRETPGQKKP